MFLIWYADLDRHTREKKQPGDGLKGITPAMINGISGEILSLQSLSDMQRALESELNQKLQRQRTEVTVLRVLVMLLIGLAIGVVGWQIRTALGSP